MNAQDLMTKAVQAIASAKVLLETGDADGACNRAYYGMFDAVRAALLASGGDVGKTHRGVLNAFNDRFVKNGPLSKDMAQCLKQAEVLRQVADYEGDPVAMGNAQNMVQQADAFICAMRTRFVPGDAKPEHRAAKSDVFRQDSQDLAQTTGKPSCT